MRRSVPEDKAQLRNSATDVGAALIVRDSNPTVAFVASTYIDSDMFIYSNFRHIELPVIDRSAMRL